MDIKQKIIDELNGLKQTNDTYHIDEQMQRITINECIEVVSRNLEGVSMIPESAVKEFYDSFLKT